MGWDATRRSLRVQVWGASGAVGRELVRALRDEPTIPPFSLVGLAERFEYDNPDLGLDERREESMERMRRRVVWSNVTFSSVSSESCKPIMPSSVTPYSMIACSSCGISCLVSWKNRSISRCSFVRYRLLMHVKFLIIRY